MVTRLSGGLTPADGADPRTFPAIWNSTAVDIEAAESDIDALQLDVASNGTAITALQGSAVALGSAVDVLEADVETLEQDKVGVLSAGSNSVSLDFSSATPLVTRTASGAVTVSGTNYEAGVSRTLRILGGGSSYGLTVPGDWVFVGSPVGTAVPANETVIITATAFGTAATDVVAAYAEEA